MDQNQKPTNEAKREREIKAREELNKQISRFRHLYFVYGRLPTLAFFLLTAIAILPLPINPIYHFLDAGWFSNRALLARAHYPDIMDFTQLGLCVLVLWFTGKMNRTMKEEDAKIKAQYPDLCK